MAIDTNKLVADRKGARSRVAQDLCEELMVQMQDYIDDLTKRLARLKTEQAAFERDLNADPAKAMEERFHRDLKSFDPLIDASHEAIRNAAREIVGKNYANSSNYNDLQFPTRGRNPASFGGGFD